MIEPQILDQIDGALAAAALLIAYEMDEDGDQVDYQALREVHLNVAFARSAVERIRCRQREGA